MVTPAGSSAAGSISTRSASPGAAVSSTPCSCPGRRRMKNWRVPRQAGALTYPAAISSWIRACSRDRPASPASVPAHSESCAASHSRVPALAASSSQRYGSGTRCPCTTSARSSRRAAGYPGG